MSDIFFQMFLSSSTYPEIHGYLHAKEQGKKSWKKLFFLLRRSGLYFSTKGTSKVRQNKQTTTIKKRERIIKLEQIYTYLLFAVILAEIWILSYSDKGKEFPFIVDKIYREIEI